MVHSKDSKNILEKVVKKHWFKGVGMILIKVVGCFT
jgi:hypothetical protein